MDKNEAIRLMLIDKILNTEPPYNKDDLYHLNDYWAKYGGISSGICMRWYWYKNIRQLSLGELEDVANKLK